MDTFRVKYELKAYSSLTQEELENIIKGISFGDCIFIRGNDPRSIANKDFFDIYMFTENFDMGITVEIEFAAEKMILDVKWAVEDLEKVLKADFTEVHALSKAMINILLSEYVEDDRHKKRYGNFLQIDWDISMFEDEGIFDYDIPNEIVDLINFDLLHDAPVFLIPVQDGFIRTTNNQLNDHLSYLEMDGDYGLLCQYFVMTGYCLKFVSQKMLEEFQKEIECDWSGKGILVVKRDGYDICGQEFPIKEAYKTLRDINSFIQTDPVVVGDRKYEMFKKMQRRLERPDMVNLSFIHGITPDMDQKFKEKEKEILALTEELEYAQLELEDIQKNLKEEQLERGYDELIEKIKKLEKENEKLRNKNENQSKQINALYKENLNYQNQAQIINIKNPKEGKYSFSLSYNNDQMFNDEVKVQILRILKDTVDKENDEHNPTRKIDIAKDVYESSDGKKMTNYLRLKTENVRNGLKGYRHSEEIESVLRSEGLMMEKLEGGHIKIKYPGNEKHSVIGASTPSSGGTGNVLAQKIIKKFF